MPFGRAVSRGISGNGDQVQHCYVVGIAKPMLHPRLQIIDPDQIRGDGRRESGVLARIPKETVAKGDGHEVGRGIGCSDVQCSQRRPGGNVIGRILGIHEGGRVETIEVQIGSSGRVRHGQRTIDAVMSPEISLVIRCHFVIGEAVGSIRCDDSLHPPAGIPSEGAVQLDRVGNTRKTSIAVDLCSWLNK